MAAVRIRKLHSGGIRVQVLAGEQLTIQVITDRVEIIVKAHSGERNAVQKIAASIVSVASAAAGFLDPSSGFPSRGGFLAVMLCFCFGLLLLMLSEVRSKPPVSVSMARKLMLLVLLLVHVAVAMRTAMLLIAAASEMG